MENYHLNIMIKPLSRRRATVTSFSVYVLVYLSPLNPPILGDFERILFLVPPELGARGRLIADLTRFYELCVQGSAGDGGWGDLDKLQLF